MKDEKKYLGLKIKECEFDEANDTIILSFENGLKIQIYDDGQSCCERRYMRTDDDVSFLNGKILNNISIKDGPQCEDENGEPHEIQFLEIMTNLGSITFTSHVEHNGYYGGFYVVIKEINEST